MRIALLSDIHGNWDGLQIVLSHLAGQAIDQIICLGDLVDGGDGNDAVVEWMRSPQWSADRHTQAINPIRTVCGNHDLANDCHLKPENQAWLNQLPELIVEGDVAFTHISPRSPQRKISTAIEAWNVFDDTDFWLCCIGHIHFPALFGDRSTAFGEAESYPVDQGCYPLDPDDRYIISVGAIGYPRGGGKYIRYGILDLAAKTVEFVRLPGPLLPYGLC